LFQRKFTRNQGQGPVTGDGAGDINAKLAIGAGLVDSCAGCHGRPRGTAGAGGNVVTRPDSRDAPHLFGLGLKEMLADEITADLRDIRRSAIKQAKGNEQSVTLALETQGDRLFVALCLLDRRSADVAQVGGDLVGEHFLEAEPEEVWRIPAVRTRHDVPARAGCAARP